MAKLPKAEIKAKVDAAADALQLGALLDRKPKALSGGQSASAMQSAGPSSVDPKVFLFDEPLSNLDAALRAQMRIELSHPRHRKLGATMIYVTHDQVEAMTMADKIVALNGGSIEQVGSPMELYNAPVSPFVAGFIGSPKMNLYDGKAAGETCTTYGIRPEHLRLTSTAPRWTGAVRHVERLGADTIVYLSIPGMGEMVVRADPDQFPDW
ncbi:MAG: TOBE domain-containing protein [Saprospiraceae bacterium]|nr:TOBE domain-containing protein [Saprospiraceae bacterium]